jgi:ABC-type branched-subunit amino acid transport system substrate-binding protein/DNA-binding beta-propeller fold protein YncE/predicted Ser/Thr protein kinase
MKAAFTPGTTFASYRVESLLGRGGMGVVYLAQDPSLERPVALKLIAPELVQDEDFRARFLREPKLAASLDHPNVIPIYEAGEHDGQLYLAMRYVKGTDLRALLEREGKLSAERAIEVVGQIAGALDAAHERGLVHRDVKPGNVLLDEAGHPYLTDFGITKPAEGDAMDTGDMVGTLDYLAPEQIRGEAVDGRTDCYALACVLYECLTGTPPFRRPTEAETLWAHLQNDPRPVRGQAALNRVLDRALAKEKNDRYPSCTEFVAAAAGAMGVAPQGPAAGVLARARRRRAGRVLLAGGAVLLLAAATAAITMVGNDDGEYVPPPRNGIAAFDGRDTQLASFTETGTRPSSLAAGEGSMWAIGLDGTTVMRVDAATRQVEKRFKLDRRAESIAAGAGAVWLDGDGELSRMDPRTGGISSITKLPSGGIYPGDVPAQNWGYPSVAVGAGAVWVINEDRSVSRIDPATGRRLARIRVDALTIAAGREGVWFVNGDETRTLGSINPRTNRPGQTIRVGAQNLSAVAVGDGAVWASAEGDGLVWRIDPGPDPLLRSIDVGVGVTFLAYGGGAIWTANYRDGTVSRIDVETNEVESSPVGAVQSLAAGDRTAWVSTAGATSADGLPESCRRLMSGGRDPDVLIASDLPLQGDYVAGTAGTVAAIELVLRQHGFKAGQHTLGYRSCDDSTAHLGTFDRRTCAANAHSYAQAEKLVAVIGTYNSDCAMIEIPILNRAPGGPVGMISPSNTYSGLTRRGQPAPWGYRGEPSVFYPTGVRNYVRLPPLDDTLGTAQAILAKQLDLRSVYILDDGSVFWRGLLIDPFRYAARRLGVPIAGQARFEMNAPVDARLLDDIERSDADGVVLTGDPFGSVGLLKALRARFGNRLKILGDFYYAAGKETLDATDGAARGMYVATSDVSRRGIGLTPEGRRFMEAYGPDVDGGFVLEAAQATELLVQAIARSDGTRASVLRELKAGRVRDGILGSFRFDRNGDLTPAKVGIVRITAKDRVLDRVVSTPRRLIR